MKRPILVAVIGYIIGIIMGLYFDFSIAPFYLFIIILTAFFKIIKKILIRYNLIKLRKKKFSFYSLSRYFRYFKLIFNQKVLIIIILFSCLSNFIVIEKNKKYEVIYNLNKEVGILARVVSGGEEKEYKDVYKIQTLRINNYKKSIDLYLNVDKKIKLKYGEMIEIKGIYKAPEKQRNYGGFCYRDYLKTLNIYGTVNADKIEVLKEAQNNDIFVLINKMKENIKQNAKKYLENETYSIYLGIILGDNSYIEDDIKETFKNSSMSHILAISGMHITYIVIGIFTLFNKISGKKFAQILGAIILAFYIMITGFSPSLIRACILAIIMLFGKILNRKEDFWTSIAISLFVILIYNPFLITNIGLQLSYMGTFGIVLFNKNIIRLLTLKRYRNKYKKIRFGRLKKFLSEENKIKQIIGVSFSVQLFIFPLLLFHFNIFSLLFLITNLILSLIIGPIVILGFILLVIFGLNLSFFSFLVIPMKLGIKTILLISKIGCLPFSKIYVKTPKIEEVIIYYIFVIFTNFIFTCFIKKQPSNTNLRVKYMIQLIKYNYRKYSKKIISGVLIIIVLFSMNKSFISNKLKIHFVDVGQGDCCFVETPRGKTIIIDGGGSEFGNFDVGKSTLLPYILDRGYTKIDYIFISHFDSDHVKGLLTVLKELDVNNVIITAQSEICNNYKEFIDIVKSKKINVRKVKQGDRVVIERDIYFDILWPKGQNLVEENGLNNNSMVCKLNYNEFSILFTGDIEEIAEGQIIYEYKNNKEKLKSTVLKVAHHGSKTSSIQEFLDDVKPKIALIGVGENNKFGHPNDEVINRLKAIRYRNL